MKYRIALTIVSFSFIIAGCNDTNNYEKDLKNEKMLNSEIFNPLRGKSVYFGHRSVGSNIIGGMESIISRDKDLSFIKIITPDEYLMTDNRGNDSTFYFIHSGIGKNGFPDSKIADFISKLDTLRNIDAAFLKFCYIDINRNTDVNLLYSNYTTNFQSLEKKYDSIKFVYFTSPLTIRRSFHIRFIKAFIGKPDDNNNRNKFNQLLRETDNVRIFDLAHHESHLEGDVRELNREFLLQEYSSDGRHLNIVGSEKMAFKLLIYLNNLFKEH